LDVDRTKVLVKQESETTTDGSNSEQSACVCDFNDKEQEDRIRRTEK